MPNWKKVVTSGSNAHFNQITASAFRFKGSGTAELEVDGHITASGNISASGTLSALSFAIDNISTGNITASGNISSSGAINTNSHITASGNISASGTGYFKDLYLKENTPSLTLDANPATGDGTIQFKEAGSNAFSISTIVSDNRFQIYNNYTSTNIFNITGSNVGIGTQTPTEKLQVTGNISSSGYLSTLSHITASGNISSSGTINSKGVNSNGAVLPVTSNGAALGSASQQWSDLFLASGGVINFNNGDTSITDNDNNLTIAGHPTSFGIRVKGQITASGNISSSGTIITEKLNVNPKSPTSPDMSFGSWNIGYGSTGTEFTGSLTSVGNGYGEIAHFGNGTTIAGRVYCLKPDLTWELAAAIGAVSSSLLGLAMGTHASASGMLLRGVARSNAHDTLVAGQKVYNEANGRIAKGAGADSGDVVRVLGYALSNGTTPAHIYFNPDNTWVEHS